MTVFIARRFLSLAATLVAASIVIFLVMEVLPGDPASYMLGLNAQPDTVAALRHQLGLDQPLAHPLHHLGPRLLPRRFRHQLHLPGAGVGAHRRAALGQRAAGALRARPVDRHRLSGRHPRRRAIAIRPADLAIMGVTQLGIAIPNFWFAMLLVLAFSIGAALVFRRRLPRLGAAASCPASRR